jgi:DNA (cytosine-5)-methyltransferase 1
LAKVFYEFFAGGGMARAGLGKGWSCSFANDVCEKKAAIYRANWGDEHLTVADIYSLSSTDLPGHADLAWASFPCQDLSLAGNYKGLAGERSAAFWGFWGLIEKLSRENRKPRVIALENVIGMLTSRNGRDFRAIATALASEGYVFGAMVIDGALFVPQSRPRLFIVAIDATLAEKNSVVGDSPDPLWHNDSVVRAYKSLPENVQRDWRWFRVPPPAARETNLVDVLEDPPIGVAWHSTQETQRLLAMMDDNNRGKVVAAQRKRRLTVGSLYKRTRNGIQRAEVRFDGLAGCLRTPGGGSSRQTLLFVAGQSVRSRLISPREAARLMGLPEAYVLPRRYNDAYMLAGDGLVVPAVRFVSKNVINKALSGKDFT